MGTKKAGSTEGMLPAEQLVVGRKLRCGWLGRAASWRERMTHKAKGIGGPESRAPSYATIAPMQDPVSAIRFRYSVPLSKKNSREAGGRRPKRAALEAQSSMQFYLQYSLKYVPWPSDDVEVQIQLYPRANLMDVTVRRIGPRPKGFSGRRRDLASCLDVTLDAMQGAVYNNDNQVARLIVEREYGLPPQHGGIEHGHHQRNRTDPGVRIERTHGVRPAPDAS